MELTPPSCERKPCLEEVQAQFEQWRRYRGKRRAIPETLWMSAASLYPEHSLHHISRTLRLNHTALKRYVKEPLPDPAMAAGEAFIELGFAAGPVSDRPCVIELWQPNGSRMIVRDADGQHLMTLARLFWSRP